MRFIRHLPLALTILAGALLALSLVGIGGFRDDRVGCIEIKSGRLVWCTRNGLIMGSALEPDQYDVYLDISYDFNEPLLPLRAWHRTLADFQTDGEDSECGCSVLPLGIPFAALLTLTSSITTARFLRRSLRRRRGLCPRCAYDLRATPAGSPCPECGTPRHTQTTPSVPRACASDAEALASRSSVITLHRCPPRTPLHPTTSSIRSTPNSAPSLSNK